jgi:hypothetical protein
MAAMEEVVVSSGVGRRCSARREAVAWGAAESRSFYTRIALCGSLQVVVQPQMNVGFEGDVGVAMGGWRVQTSMFLAMLQRPDRQLQVARNGCHVIARSAEA